MYELWAAFGSGFITRGLVASAVIFTAAIVWTVHILASEIDEQPASEFLSATAPDKIEPLRDEHEGAFVG